MININNWCGINREKVIGSRQQNKNHPPSPTGTPITKNIFLFYVAPFTKGEILRYKKMINIKNSAGYIG